MGTPMQALQQENAQLMARLAEMQAECQPTEEYAEVMNKAIADAAEAETQRDAALARVEQLEAQLRDAIESNVQDLLRQVERERVGIDLLRQLDDRYGCM
jgi:predicted RNase H-like nuclease (RuvC/YqgF family)